MRHERWLLALHEESVLSVHNVTRSLPGQGLALHVSAAPVAANAARHALRAAGRPAVPHVLSLCLAQTLCLLVLVLLALGGANVWCVVQGGLGVCQGAWGVRLEGKGCLAAVLRLPAHTHTHTHTQTHTHTHTHTHTE